MKNRNSRDEILAEEGGEAALSQDELRRSFRIHSPLSHPLRIAPERTLIVAGRGDRIVPPEHPAALSAYWGGPAIHWFSGSHLAPFGRARVIRAPLTCNGQVVPVAIKAFDAQGLLPAVVQDWLDGTDSYFHEG